jgi:hypothetical protein
MSTTETSENHCKKLTLIKSELNYFKIVKLSGFFKKLLFLIEKLCYNERHIKLVKK